MPSAPAPKITVLHVIDAFTDRPFAGNPAAVCVLPAPRDDVWMQLVAREMNLSETAFVNPVADGFALRWFTPTTEVKLCGHATLASAHTLWTTGVLSPSQPARFHTLSGCLTCRRTGDWIEMDFPALPVNAAEAPPELLPALGVQPLFVGKAVLHWLVEVADEPTLRALQPDFQGLGAIPVQGIIVTARSTVPGFDFVSRYFAPASGVNEDPVTGSSHAALGPYWQSKLRQDDFTAQQASARGGVIKIGVRNDRVLLSGQAVTVSRVELLH